MKTAMRTATPLSACGRWQHGGRGPDRLRDPLRRGACLGASDASPMHRLRRAAAGTSIDAVATEVCRGAHAFLLNASGVDHVCASCCVRGSVQKFTSCPRDRSRSMSSPAVQVSVVPEAEAERLVEAEEPDEGVHGPPFRRSPRTAMPEPSTALPRNENSVGSCRCPGAPGWDVPLLRRRRSIPERRWRRRRQPPILHPGAAPRSCRRSQRRYEMCQRSIHPSPSMRT